ncbi:MAG: FliG C-terminal domain-containing protein [Planctomycetota bacterium]
MTDSQHLRRIAILVSSVDASAAQQILLDLPPLVAKGVRAAIQDLDGINTQEHQQVIHELQTATSLATSSEDRSVPNIAWDAVPTDSIVRMIQLERPLLIAFVLSRLAVEKATQVLASLEPQTAYLALQSLATLEEPNPAFTTRLEAFLLQNAHKHQNQIEVEAKNRQRMESLLSGVPSRLQQQWTNKISKSHDQPPQSEQETAPQATMVNHLTSSTADTSLLVAADLQSEFSTTSQHVSLVESRMLASNPPASTSPVDRSLIQLEFDQLLDLPAKLLQEVLNKANPEIVLLAFAGASSEFMCRFREMIEPEDYADLIHRMNQLGAMRIADADEAQMRLTVVANKMLQESPTQKALKNVS